MSRSLNGAVLAAALLSLGACSDSNNRGSAPAPSSSAVANIAAGRSETAEPFAINNGAFAFNDTSETSDPRSINR